MNVFEDQIDEVMMEIKSFMKLLEKENKNSKKLEKREQENKPSKKVEKREQENKPSKKVEKKEHEDKPSKKVEKKVEEKKTEPQKFRQSNLELFVGS